MRRSRIRVATLIALSTMLPFAMAGCSETTPPNGKIVAKFVEPAHEVDSFVLFGYVSSPTKTQVTERYCFMVQDRNIQTHRTCTTDAPGKKLFDQLQIGDNFSVE